MDADEGAPGLERAAGRTPRGGALSASSMAPMVSGVLYFIYISVYLYFLSFFNVSFFLYISVHFIVDRKDSEMKQLTLCHCFGTYNSSHLIWQE